MLVHFVGLCMFDITQVPPKAFLPNLKFGLPDHPQARPHEAFIAVPPNTVEFGGWGSPDVKQVPALNNGVFWTFPLDGVEISFLPAPSGGSMDVSVLRQMRDVVNNNCPDKTQPKDLESATSELLAARVLIPGGELKSFNIPIPDGSAPGPDATNLTVADRVTIVGTSIPDAFGHGGGVTRVLRMLDTPAIAICNVDPMPVDANDLADLELYCALMEDPTTPAARAAAARRPRPRAFPITLGPGCSNTQWP